MANVLSAVRGLDHPTQIGPYTIVELIGEGGMGSVYKAQQTTPLQRTVAIKVIKLGMDTREVVARFESERQALALMNHPNVARVLDAGATETGRPYFVMEFVEGEPITMYADRRKLSVTERLKLFRQACDAVQHAHQKAIIHRDLKPSNILVTPVDGGAVVKVIDFGVAKALHQRLTQRTLFTESGQLLGTPEFMAPEQADPSADIDTRSDVYSLGVVLYELLAGALPFDAGSLRSAGYQEIQRIIREVDPPRPSTRVSRLGASAADVATKRQLSPDSLARKLKGELEWIPLKAMRKEREQRYASPQELSDDIENYLENRPLRAGPESRRYRLGKFLRRNRRGVAALTAMILLLVAGLAATTWQMFRATRAERDARAASDDLAEVNRFLTDDLLASASPEITRGREMTVREAVDRAAAAVAQRFRGRPLVEARVRVVLASTYSELGEVERALENSQAALVLLREARGPDHRDTLDVSGQVGQLLAKLNRHEQAEPLLRDALARAQRNLGEDHDVTIGAMGALAMTLRLQERFEEADALYRRVLELDERNFGEDSEQVAQALNNLAVSLNTQKRPADAEPLYRRALVIREKNLGPDHPSYLTTLSNLSRVLEAQDKRAEAIELMERVLSEQRRVLKDDHPSATLTMNNLAGALFAIGRREESIALHREALERRLRTLGPDHVDTLQSMSNLGTGLTNTGKPAEAIPFLSESWEGRRRVLGETHAYTTGTAGTLARAYMAERQFAEARAVLEWLRQPDKFASLPPRVQAAVVARLGIALHELKDPSAEAALLDAARHLESIGPSVADQARDVLTTLLTLYQGAGRSKEADEVRAKLSALAPATAPATRPG
jgi:eukaryotic-like serine/threonine-protein kinase